MGTHNNGDDNFHLYTRIRTGIAQFEALWAGIFSVGIGVGGENLPKENMGKGIGTIPPPYGILVPENLNLKFFLISQKLY